MVRTNYVIRVPLISLVLLAGTSRALLAEFVSHAPTRPLPVASDRPLETGPSYFVDPVNGDDEQQGTRMLPWKSINFAVKQLKPGDVLYLRGGIYYESVRIAVRGTPEKPITIRAYPGELPVVDAGYGEFYEMPAAAWEPIPDGSVDEFRSTKTYSVGGNGGNFGDSMIPFHRYITFSDLRSSNELYRQTLNNRADDPVGMYCGPGVRRDKTTGRIHVRLSHTKLDGLGENHYRGATDPRKIPLIIVGQPFGLLTEGAKHIRVRDLVVRGASDASVRISHGENIELDGLTLYANFLALRTDNTNGLRIIHSALRGHAAPWHSRFHHKNRAGSGYLVLTGPNDANFEFAYCELTDHHDAMTFGSVNGVRIHHNLLENFNDDGIEPGPKQERGTVLVYENVLSRILNPFTAHGNKKEPIASEPGIGIYVYRNVIDLRQGTYKSPPAQPDPSGSYLNDPTELVLHDHGSPIQPNYYVYHNTFLTARKPYRNYYAFTWGAHTHGTTRRVFNNIFVQIDDPPLLNLSAISPGDDFQADGNLYWAVKQGREFTGDLFESVRRSPLFETSKQRYAPGWSRHDRFADPKFVALDLERHRPGDFRLQADSPAIDAGLEIPTEWPDSFREKDQGRPDIGAIPQGAPPLVVGPATALQK